jgi:AraC-like DNA-binding protein
MTSIDRIEYKNLKKETADIEISDLQDFYKTRPPSHLNRDYRLNFWIILYITDGEGDHFVDFVKYHYKAGDIIILQKNQVHHFLINKQAQGYILILNEPFFFDNSGLSSKPLFEFFNRPYTSPVISINNAEGTANRILMELIQTEYQKLKNSDSEAFIRSLMQSFILSLDNFSNNRNFYSSAEFHTYNRFRNLLEENYTAKRAVNDYAKLMNVTKKTINSATRAVVGLSAKEFIVDRIILEIKRYLSLGDLLTYEISDRLGFDESSNMTKFFKRYTGVSPTKFKESLN